MYELECALSTLHAHTFERDHTNQQKAGLFETDAFCRTFYQPFDSTMILCLTKALLLKQVQ